MAVPNATCRLQLTPSFGFDDARVLLPHLSRLGISHLYLSPIFEAVPGSSHGYDVVDPCSIRRELGGPEAFDHLAAACERARMGIIVDIVPNHMSASHHNTWWYDVLKHGRDSRYAGYFDIYWDDTEFDSIVLPVLGRPLDDVIQAGELTVQDSASGPEIAYFEQRFPLSDESGAYFAGASNGRGMRELLQRQKYQLVYWRDGLKNLNYRRFFDIAELVGVCVGDPDVFDATHRLIIDLVKKGKVSGLRVDHIDGLREPGSYLDRLDSAVGAEAPYVVVEKVLAAGEKLPPAWRAHGTTGYGWLNHMNGVFVDPVGLEQLEDLRRDFTGDSSGFDDVSGQSKLDVMDGLFSAELSRLAVAGVRLGQILGCPILTSDDFVSVIRVLTSRLDKYRTYVGDSKADADKRNTAPGLLDPPDEASDSEREAMSVFERALKQDVPAGVKAAATLFIERWQQLSGAVMAKGVEDTALYRYTSLASMNEVGGEPSSRFASVDGFHVFNRSNAEADRLSLLASSTHDTKWSEDARARVNVISEMPGVWRQHVEHWASLNRRFTTVVGGRRCPSPDAELRFYQALAAVLPPGDNPSEFGALEDRLAAYMVKAAREAKQETKWLDPDEEYERSLRLFVHGVLTSPGAESFRASFSALAGNLSFHGAVNSLGQVILKVCSPGVPDFYQGCERWNLSLVDPDNRRPVAWHDLSSRLESLERVGSDEWDATARKLFTNWPDGGIKQWITRRALAVRSGYPALFATGSYAAVEVSGPSAQHVVSIERQSDDARVIGAISRCSAGLGAQPGGVTGHDAWNNTFLRIAGLNGRRFEDALTGRVHVARSDGLDAGDIFELLPVALLVERSP